MKLLRAVGLLAALLAAVTGCGSSGSSVETIRIGAMYSLSGDQASLDENSLRGAQLAVEQINGRGGVLGSPISLAVRDAKSSGAEAGRQAQDLFEQERVSVVVGLSDTDVALPVAKLSQTLGALFVTSGATGPSLVVEAPDSTFLACFSDDAQAKAAAQYAARQLRLRSVAIVFDEQSQYASVLTQSFRAEFRRLGGSVYSEQRFSRSALDVASLAAETKKIGAPGVFLAGQPEEVSSIISALRSNGVDVPILGGDSYDSPLVSGLPDAQKRGVYFTTHVLLVPDSHSSQIDSFVQEYEARYGERPTSAFAALGYDAVQLVAQAIESAGTTEPGALRHSLESIRGYPAVTGKLSYAPGQHVPTKEVTVVTFVGSVPVRAATIAMGAGRSN